LHSGLLFQEVWTALQAVQTNKQPNKQNPLGTATADCRPFAYITLKRLMFPKRGGKDGQRGRAGGIQSCKDQMSKMLNTAQNGLPRE